MRVGAFTAETAQVSFPAAASADDLISVVDTIGDFLIRTSPRPGSSFGDLSDLGIC